MAVYHRLQTKRRSMACLASPIVSGIELDVTDVIEPMKPYLLICSSLQKWALSSCFMLFMLLANPSVAGDAIEKDIRLASDVSVPVRINPADGNRLLLWFPSEYGFVDEAQELANSLASSGIEVWRVDLLAAYFLPPVPSSINKVPVADIAAVIESAIRNKSKTVTIFADGRGAVLALRGVKQWQHSRKSIESGLLTGAILLSPNLYTETPQPGKVAQYLQITKQSAVNTVVLQPQMSPWYWWRDRLRSELTQHGSHCEIRVLQGVRDRFFFRPDASSAENQLATKLPELILKSMTRLEKMQAGTK